MVLIVEHNLLAIVYTYIPRYVRNWGPGIKTVVSMLIYA